MIASKVTLKDMGKDDKAHNGKAQTMCMILGIPWTLFMEAADTIKHLNLAGFMTIPHHG